MKYRAAFASSDGKVVNQHFGRARQFLILDIDDENKTWEYVETRENDPPCDGGTHSDDALEQSAGIINDCRAVFVARIGTGAQSLLAEKHIQAIELPYPMEDIIHALLHAKVKLIYER
jgi:predicted Fe-Mo cluster-binding NifX family protein